MRTILPQVLLLCVLSIGIGAGLVSFSVKHKSRELVLSAPPGPLHWWLHGEPVLVGR